MNDDWNPNIDMLPGEVICPTTHYSYNGGLNECPHHYAGEPQCDEGIDRGLLATFRKSLTQVVLCK